MTKKANNNIKVKQKQNVNVHVNVNTSKRGKKRGSMPTHKRPGVSTYPSYIPFNPVLIQSGFPNQFQPQPTAQPVASNIY